MHPLLRLRKVLPQVIWDLYGVAPDEGSLTLQPTKKEFPGDYTLVTFPFTRQARKAPEVIGREIGESLVREHPELVEATNVIQGFLNIELRDRVWMSFLIDRFKEGDPAFPDTGEKILVEFSSPNTNKPLHLGHIRNILLGWSMSRILDRVGHEVFRVQVINDRGIAICKSMLAWQKYGQGATPVSTGIKGDHLVGDFYVRFETAFREEYARWQGTTGAEQVWSGYRTTHPEASATDREDFFKNYRNTYFNEVSALGGEARQMLLDWEHGDPNVMETWRMMNQWVIEGFQTTYDALGVSFDRSYVESQTYLLGKDIVEEGLASGVFTRDPDGSVWIDLTDEGLDRKLVLRSDGTSVYITQDLGTAQDRYKDFGANRMIYVVADEQNYHFQVLFAILKRLGAPYADGLHHLSYGMVELPTGRMKSREGTVVDADDLIEEVIAEARKSAEERGETMDLPEAERREIDRLVGLAALKFHMIKVNPRKRMIFDPQESVDLQGHTGPYIQNAYVRIRSVFRKTGPPGTGRGWADYALQPGEKELLMVLAEYPDQIRQAATDYDPSVLANYAYTVAKAFHKFYHDHSMIRAESDLARDVRLALSEVTSRTLKDAMDLLGIGMPDRM